MQCGLVACMTEPSHKLNMDETLKLPKLPKSLVVTVEIALDRISEFLNIIEVDAIGSRNNENGGCLRFDVLQDRVVRNRFVFYEV